MALLILGSSYALAWLVYSCQLRAALERAMYIQVKVAR